MSPSEAADGAGAAKAAPDPVAVRWPDGDPDAPLPMLFSLRGRISRRRFWRWGVGALLVLAALTHALLGIARVRTELADPLVNLLLLWPAVAISVKRWHDRGRTGWWVLVGLVPVVGWLWLLIDNGLVRGTAGPNRYGAAPMR